jgi:hypothetical protein
LNNKKAKQLKNDLPQRFKDLLGEPIDLSVDFKELKLSMIYQLFRHLLTRILIMAS